MAHFPGLSPRNAFGMRRVTVPRLNLDDAEGLCITGDIL